MTTKITLDDGDAAIVWRANGNMDLILPDQDSDAPLDGPATTAGAVALVFSLDHPNPKCQRIRDDIYGLLEEESRG